MICNYFCTDVYLHLTAASNSWYVFSLDRKHIHEPMSYHLCSTYTIWSHYRSTWSIMSYPKKSIFLHFKLKFEVYILSRLIIALRLKDGCTILLTVSLQFAKHLFGVRPFSNPQNNTIKIIITVVRVSFTPVYMFR